MISIVATKTIAEKLQIKPGSTVWSLPAGHLALIGPMVESASTVTTFEESTVAFIFSENAAEVRSQLDELKATLPYPGILWMAYPKGNKADINRDSLWKIVVDYGMRPNGQIAIDDKWSALRFRANKPGEERFTGGGNS
jgi:hypothetical protein